MTKMKRKLLFDYNYYCFVLYFHFKIRDIHINKYDNDAHDAILERV